jgi:tetratricopeptide (TPR) repeat protein
MKIKTIWIKISILALILLFYSLGIFHQTNLPTQDIGRHIQNGQIIWQTKSVNQTNLYSYTYPDYPFLNHHWLSGLIFYFLFGIAGFKGLIVFKSILLLAAFLIVFILAAKKGNFWLVAIFSIPVIFILNQRTEIRPEIFSYFLISLFLYFLVCFGQKPGWKIYWLIPLQLFWVNSHIYFFIGILMTAGYLLEQIIFKRRNIRKISFLLLCLILVSFVNPAGLAGLLAPLNIFENYGYQIVENKSPFFLEHLMEDPAIPFFKIIIAVLALSFVFNLRKFSPFFFLASAGVILAGCQMIRNFPLVGLIALPAISINLKPLLKFRWKPLKRIFPWFLALSLIVIVLLVFNGQTKLNNKHRGVGLTEQSVDSTAFFKEENLSGPIFNNYDIGSYLIFELYPQEKIFVDNRPEAYPESFFEEIYKPIQQNEEKWKIYSEKYNFNLIFFTHQESTPWGREFLIKRLADPGWILVQADSQSVILVKNKPANQAIIEKFQITPENIENRISSLINSPEIKLKMASINLLELTGQYDLAINVCESIIKDHPESAQAHLQMASLESRSTETVDLLSARRHLEKAIQLGKGLPSIYNSFGLIHFRLNKFKEAEKAWQEALKIDKDNEHALYYLEQYQNLNLPL